MGKGLTFDSGGYNIKVGGMIELMKFDMGGAGAVFGAAQIIADLKPEGVEVKPSLQAHVARGGTKLACGLKH